MEEQQMVQLLPGFGNNRPTGTVTSGPWPRPSALTPPLATSPSPYDPGPAPCFLACTGGPGPPRQAGLNQSKLLLEIKVVITARKVKFSRFIPESAAVGALCCEIVSERLASEVRS